ncbi:MAG: hypothetical protein ACUVST_14050 [Anaerolineae bacterium]
MKAYVYALHGLPGDLRTWTSVLREPLAHWVANPARLTMGTDLPDDWKGQGAVFGPKGELRWWRTETGYRALLLTGEAVNGLPPLPGEWTAEEETLYLQDLADRRLKPNFAAYSHGAKDGRVRARVYYRDGAVTFVSPRELLKG